MIGSANRFKLYDVTSRTYCFQKNHEHRAELTFTTDPLETRNYNVLKIGFENGKVMYCSFMAGGGDIYCTYNFNLKTWRHSGPIAHKWDQQYAPPGWTDDHWGIVERAAKICQSLRE